jgi:hypothetical protein
MKDDAEHMKRTFIRPKKYQSKKIEKNNCSRYFDSPIDNSFLQGEIHCEED